MVGVQENAISMLWFLEDFGYLADKSHKPHELRFLGESRSTVARTKTPAVFLCTVDSNRGTYNINDGEHLALKTEENTRLQCMQAAQLDRPPPLSSVAHHSITVQWCLCGNNRGLQHQQWRAADYVFCAQPCSGVSMFRALGERNPPRQPSTAAPLR